MTETYPITLDVSKLDTLHTGYAFMQNDRKVHELVFSVNGLELTAQSTIELRFLRPDNQVVAVESDQLTVSGGKVHYVVQSNVLEKAGVAHGILSVLPEGGRRSTGQFTFTVAGDIDKDEAIMGDDRLPLVQKLLETMEESALLCEQSEKDAKDYAEQATESARGAIAAREVAESERAKAEEASSKAQGYAAGAATSETNAAESAKKASDSASAAATSERNAKEAEQSAGISAYNANMDAKAAANSAGTASESAREAIAAREVAESERAKAEEASSKAQGYATTAANSEANVAESAKEASDSATAAATSEANAAKSAKEASDSATAAATSERNANESKTSAGVSAYNANMDAKAAANSASSASASATAARESMEQTQAIADEINGKKVTVIDENSDDEHYPSAKAVRDYVDMSIAGMPIKYWNDVQSVVRSGLASKVFSIGDQLVCNHETYGELVWDIIGFDHDVPSDETKTHSMTLQLHSLLQDSLAFDAKEALYYAETELHRGTYYFVLLSGYDTEHGGGMAYFFTIENPVPAGGCIVLNWQTNQSPSYIETFGNLTSTTAIERANVQIGAPSESIYLEATNHTHRARYGYSRWSQSAIRQWLNSDKESGQWWTPQNTFDRPTNYADTNVGFLKGLDADFRSVLGEVKKRTALSTIDGGGYEDTNELMFLISTSEAYGGKENGIEEGTPYPYYSEASDLIMAGPSADTNRIKYLNGEPKYWWFRSTVSAYLHFARAARNVGNIDGSYSSSGSGLAPICNII